MANRGIRRRSRRPRKRAVSHVSTAIDLQASLRLLRPFLVDVIGQEQHHTGRHVIPKAVLAALASDLATEHVITTVTIVSVIQALYSAAQRPYATPPFLADSVIEEQLFRLVDRRLLRRVALTSRDETPETYYHRLFKSYLSWSESALSQHGSVPAYEPVDRQGLPLSYGGT
jgi:hypothetical protein